MDGCNEYWVNARYKIYDDKYKVTVFNKRIIYIGKRGKRVKPVVRRKARECEMRKDNLNKSREAVFDIAYLNDFDYFCTFTIDDKKIDASDYDLCGKKLVNWLRNGVSRRGFKYLLVPELGEENGRLHFHGLLSGDLLLSDSGHCTKSDRRIYNSDAWGYGWSTAIELYGDRKNLAKYMTKYFTKNTKRILGNYYYAGGKGLKRDIPVFYDTKAFDFYDAWDVYKKDVKLENGLSFSVKYATVPLDGQIHQYDTDLPEIIQDIESVGVLFGG